MVLFFVVSMVAAYTSRNLIFEQRTAVNQYRSTQALEAAEAGLEWTVAMLNKGLIDGNCASLSAASATATSFRDRYLVIDGATGVYTPNANSTPPTCVFDGTAWDCKCPSTGTAMPTLPTSSEIHPAFRVRFQAVTSPSPSTPPPAALIKVLVSACTRLDDTCLSSTSVGAANEGRTMVSAILSISGSLASPPVAALTAHGSVNLSSTSFRVESSDNGSGGITIQSGGNIGFTASVPVLIGPPGTPGSQTLVPSDPALADAALTDDRMFSAPFNIWPATFRQQPAAVELTCGGSGCTDGQVAALAALHPRQPIWINGDLSVSADLGTSAQPLLLVVNGDLKFPSGTPTVYGLVYLRTTAWASTGAGTVRGAVIAEGSVGGSANLTLVHDPDVLGRVRFGVGSLVRVPGSWKDFP